jgi:hypothetical protein
MLLFKHCYDPHFLVVQRSNLNDNLRKLGNDRDSYKEVSQGSHFRVPCVEFDAFSL